MTSSSLFKRETKSPHPHPRACAHARVGFNEQAEKQANAVKVTGTAKLQALVYDILPSRRRCRKAVTHTTTKVSHTAIYSVFRGERWCLRADSNDATEEQRVSLVDDKDPGESVCQRQPRHQQVGRLPGLSLADHRVQHQAVHQQDEGRHDSLKQERSC